MTRSLANLTLFLAAALWGMGFVAQSTAMADLGPFFFTGIRFAAATLLLVPFALWERRRAHAKGLGTGAIMPMILTGTLLFLAIVVQQVGLITTTVTNSGFLTALYVVMVPLIGFVVLRDHPPVLVWPGAILALLGLYLLTGSDLTTMRSGDLLMVISAFFWAVQVIMVGRLMTGTTGPFTLACVQFGVTALLGLVIGIVLEPVSWTAIQAAGFEILYAGLVSGGVAFTLQIIGQRHTTSAQAALILSTESVFAALFGALFLAERLSTIGAVGAALILSAILLVELGSLRRTRPAPKLPNS